MDNLKGLTDNFKSEDSPQYGVTDSSFYISIAISVVLMILTIGMAFFLANTILSETILWLYNSFWFFGVIVVSFSLGLGWYFGLKGIDEGRMGLATVGVGISIISYGGFGGAILSLYEQSLWMGSIFITSAITVGLTIVLSAYIFTSERDFNHWLEFSGSCFILAGIGALIASFIQSFQPIIVVFVIIGFIFELGYEIWYCSQENRSSLANGFAIYFAFAGIFFHILQFVLEAMAGD